MAKLRIYHIEDDHKNSDLWRERLEDELDVDYAYEHFTDPVAAWSRGGNPDVIIFDVGSIGLQEEPVRYLDSYYKLRERFPGAWVYFVSGLEYLVSDLLFDIEDDELITTGRAMNVSDFVYFLKESGCA